MAERGLWESPWVTLPSILSWRKARTGSGAGGVGSETVYDLTPPGSGYNLWVCAGWQPLTEKGRQRTAQGISRRG